MKNSHDELAFLLGDVQHAPRLERGQELNLIARWKADGDADAGNLVVRSQLRGVVAIALRYRRYGLPLGDLVAEGNFGLMQALVKFDSSHGVRLVTYASHWIRAYVIDYVVKSWSIVAGNSGAFRSRLFFRLRRERARAFNLLGEGEAAERMAADRLGVTVDGLRAMLNRLESRDVSVDAKASNGSPLTPLDYLPAADDQEKSLFEHQVEREMRRVVSQALTTLDARERFIAERRLMADGDDELALADIGRRLGVSRERARQLEARAKLKLRGRIAAMVAPALSDWIGVAVQDRE